MNEQPSGTSTLFTDPYDKSVNKVRLQTFIDDVDHSFVRGIRGKNGTITIVANTLWKRFCESLREQGIHTCLDKARFEEFVQKMTVSAPGALTQSTKTKKIKQ
jgi:hypothetical protein